MTSVEITARTVDLTNCDREQVQFSEATQPHGCLLVLDEMSLSILRVSANTGALLGLVPNALLNGSLDLLPRRLLSAIIQHIRREPGDHGPVHLAYLTAEETGTGRPLNLFGHRCGGQILLEFELIPAGPETRVPSLYSDIRNTLARLQAAQSLQAFFDLAVAQIREFTGFERVMTYKFLEDGSGHVIAESKLDELQPFLGLHYPASDIPEPARRLFAKSWLRHLPDVDYEPIPLLPEPEPGTQGPVDLSYAMLRSVSVMYTGYLKNMGVKSSMVMPVMKEGRLWGLIACHHHSAARHVTHEVRMAAEVLAHMLSLMMANKEDVVSFASRLRSQSVLDHMIRLCNASADLHAGLGGSDGAGNIGDYIEAGGAAVVTLETVTRLGATPAESEIRALATWLSARDDLVVATDRLAEQYPQAGAMAEVAAGLLAVRLSRRRAEYVMWFRPEQIQAVHWAGDPGKPVEVDRSDGALRLMPRTSFAVWKESVAGRSPPWADFEVKAAADLRWAIAEVILARAEQTELLNRELMDSNSELDSFAYVASHDLKEPLRGIHHMTTFLQRGQGDPTEQTATILKLTKRMDDLIESLLHYSRTGRTNLALVPCDLDALLDEALAGLAPRIAETGVVIRRPVKLPKIRCDRMRLREVLANLISNAIKYNDKAEKWVEIGVEPGTPAVLYVRDNGIGIAERHHERIFEIFRRLHGRDEFGGGTGAGLTITKKTIERHDGRIWVVSTPGEGTTFFFTLEPMAGNQTP